MIRITIERDGAEPQVIKNVLGFALSYVRPFAIWKDGGAESILKGDRMFQFQCDPREVLKEARQNVEDLTDEVRANYPQKIDVFPCPPSPAE
jgi:hypothetical protein